MVMSMPLMPSSINPISQTAQLDRIGSVIVQIEAVIDNLPADRRAEGKPVVYNDFLDKIKNDPTYSIYYTSIVVTYSAHFQAYFNARYERERLLNKYREWSEELESNVPQKEELAASSNNTSMPTESNANDLNIEKPQDVVEDTSTQYTDDETAKSIEDAFGDDDDEYDTEESNLEPDFDDDGRGE